MIRAILILFVTGGIVGSFLDGLHSHNDVLVYVSPWHFQMAWWVPILFGSATVTVAFGHVYGDRFFRSRPLRPSNTQLISGIAGFLLWYAASAFVPLSPLVLTVILGIGWLCLWWFLDRSGAGMVEALLTAGLGCFIEATLIRAGKFHYLNPNLGPLPSWLPILYMAASLGVGHLGRRLLAPK